MPKFKWSDREVDDDRGAPDMSTSSKRPALAVYLEPRPDVLGMAGCRKRQRGFRGPDRAIEVARGRISRRKRVEYRGIAPASKGGRARGHFYGPGRIPKLVVLGRREEPGQLYVRNRPVGSQSRRRSELLHCARRIPARLQEAAEIVACLGVGRIDPDGFGQVTLRFVEPAEPEEIAPRLL